MFQARDDRAAPPAGRISDQRSGPLGSLRKSTEAVPEAPRLDRAADPELPANLVPTTSRCNSERGDNNRHGPSLYLRDL